MSKGYGQLGMLFGILAVLIVVAIGAAYEVSLWQECRTDHSWLYCARVLGR